MQEFPLAWITVKHPLAWSCLWPNISPELCSIQSLYRESSTLEQTTPFVRQTILLGVGTLCNKMINHMRRVYKPIPELTNAVEEISQVMNHVLSLNVMHLFLYIAVFDVCHSFAYAFRLGLRSSSIMVNDWTTEYWTYITTFLRHNEVHLSSSTSQ